MVGGGGLHDFIFHFSLLGDFNFNFFPPLKNSFICDLFINVVGID